MDDTALKRLLEDALGFGVGSMRALSGGDIASAFRLHTDNGPLFMKLMSGEQALESLKAEAEGLRAIAGTKTLRTPKIEGVFDLGASSCLVLEFIEPHRGSDRDFRAFGRSLAMMHQKEMPRFGWEQDNFIGALNQENGPAEDWAEFYAMRRLMPQYRMAVAKGLMAPSRVPGPGTLAGWLTEHTEYVRPSLLHGDLWGGNFLIAHNGEAVLIDPAVYAGHHEVDLAMTRLFGGFPEAFYRGYHSVLPQTPGHAERQQLYQLYYLLVHLNLFGGSYRQSVYQIGNRLFGL